MLEMNTVRRDMPADHGSVLNRKNIIPEGRLTHEHGYLNLPARQHLSHFNTNQSSPDNDGVANLLSPGFHLLQVLITVKSLHTLKTFSRPAKEIRFGT